MTIRQGTTIISGGGGKVTSVNGEIGDVVVKSVVNEKDNSTQLKFWLGTQEEYEQITEKDASTLYYTSGEDSSAISYDDLTDKPTINTVPLSGDMTLAELGIQGELQAGTGIDITGGTISSTITTPDASTTVKGISRYATDEETIAHTVTTAAVTPSNLADLYTTKENTANKVTTITDDATDTQYPSAAAVNSRIMHIMNNSTDFVRTSGNQTIGDTKIFTGSFYKKVNLDITQNPENNIYTDNKLITNQDDSAMSYTTLSLTTEGNIINALYLRRIINEEYKYTGFVNTIDSEGNGFTCAVSAHDRNDTLYRADSIITAGDLVNNTKDFNIVHKSGNEEIAGTKTFTSTIERTATLSSGESHLIRMTDTNNMGQTSFVSYYTNNETYARILNRNVTADVHGYLDAVVTDDGKFSVRPGGSAEYDFELDDTLQRRIDVTSLVNSRITNCITKIPQDIKLELTNGTLTLKAGSKIYIPIMKL